MARHCNLRKKLSHVNWQFKKIAIWDFLLTLHLLYFLIYVSTRTASHIHTLIRIYKNFFWCAHNIFYYNVLYHFIAIWKHHFYEEDAKFLWNLWMLFASRTHWLFERLEELLLISWNVMENGSFRYYVTLREGGGVSDASYSNFQIL